ncbi:PaaI family thioesterase [Frigidibacter sp. ROC022]|uniref:PaaI family thioesterase n=1 Tax=Frigidibacter sp. ROC022 TaxID=2971796 RepID=UPI00215A8E12|nr:PaaI family thioesterase [Frigidibacter sp. ROC022]MCR8723264.1 PaaI family thioesterase [Frigidibacter sp. ROC022]
MTRADPTIVRKVQDSFAKQGFLKTFDAEIVEILQGSVTLSAPLLPRASQQHGYGHAGLSFALGDSAAGYAALTLLPPEAEVLTVEMKINLLAPARGDRLIATGRVLRPGRRLSVVSAEVWAETGTSRKPVALLQGTMIPA